MCVSTLYHPRTGGLLFTFLIAGIGRAQVGVCIFLLSIQGGFTNTKAQYTRSCSKLRGRCRD